MDRRKLLVFGLASTAASPLLATSDSSDRHLQGGNSHYTDGMRPFSVRYLSGPHAPSLGAVTFLDSQPPPFNVRSGTNGASGQIGAWSGGCVDKATNRLFFSGGGHSDGGNNGIHVFDWSGAQNPVGFSTLKGSRSEVIPDNYNSIPAYSDGRPNAVHTYSHMPYSPRRKRIYRGWTWFWYFDEKQEKWIRLSDTRIIGPGGVVLVSPDERQLFSLSTGSSAVGRFVDADTGEIVVVGKSPYAATTSMDAVIGLDTKRNRYLMIGSNRESQMIFTLSIDWQKRQWNAARQSNPTHVETLEGGQGVAYDAAQDCFWCIGGKSECKLERISRIVRVDAESLDAVAHPLDEPIRTVSKGQYGRLIWMPEHRAIGLLPAFDSPAVVVKVPG